MPDCAWRLIGGVAMVGIGVSWFILNTPGRSVTIGCIRLLSFRPACAGCGGGVAGRAPSRRYGRRALRCVVVPWVSVRQVVRSAPRRPLPSRTARPPWSFPVGDTRSSTCGILNDTRCGAVADQVALSGSPQPGRLEGAQDACGLSTTYRVASPVRELQVEACRRSHHGERHRAVVRRP
jgi:hypothetical protein